MAEANSMAMAESAAKYDRLILQKKCTIADDCAICIDSLLTKPVMYLPCKHYFHKACLQQALEKKLYTCPLCRHDLLDALLKTDFKFPVVYDMNTFINTFFYTYPYIYPYTDDPDAEHPDEYDDMPELIDDDPDDPDVLWNQLFYNVMHNDPASLDPATLGPATLDPATLGPATLGPATLDPATLGPATLDPSTLDPASLGPARVIPVSEPDYVVQDILIIYTL
jgi:hypothetical protein